MSKSFNCYAVVSNGGSGNYEHTEFLGLAFTWAEVKAFIDSDRDGPCPGERWNITRREYPRKTTKHLTVWRHDSWEDVTKRRWHT